MSEGPHRLLLASAGTGKTFRLTAHFARLLLAGVPPERILATTFTRKAAGEILERVLARLLGAVDGARGRAELARAIGRDALGAEECERTLVRLARRLDRFRVRTLDAFFLQVARLFALELGFPPEWRIADEVEDRELRAEAVARLLAEAGRAEQLELLRDLQRSAAARSVHASLVAAVDQARGAFLESARDAWQRLAPAEGLDADALAALRAELEALALPRTKQGKPVAHWSTAREQALACLDAGEWERLFDNGLVKKLAAGEETYARHPIGDDVRGVLEPLVAHAASRLVAELARQNEAARTLLERFEGAYAALKRERGAYRFEDLPLALAPGPAAAPGTPGDPLAARELDLWYRLDGRIDHLLVDEFQDTSSLQWRILEPLATEILADGTGTRSFFCVGDVKQSIYGWRNAEPRLLAGMAARYPQLEPEPLTTSYRSSQVVLDAVDRVFEDLDANGALASRPPAAREAARAWCAAFAPHAAARELPGAAHLVEASVDRGDGESVEPAAAVLRVAADRVAAIAAEAPGATVGVLLRRNRDIPRWIYALAARGIRASGEGGNPLTDSAAVLLVVSLLAFADHPNDTAAAFHVATSPLAGAAGLGPEMDAAERSAAARALREQLVRGGYGAFCAALEPLVAEHFGGWDRRRYAQLVDLAHAYDARATLRPTDFVDQVRELRVEDPASARVKVMTIHASKGLEFDAVVLPELDGDLRRNRSAWLTDRPDAAGPITSVSRRPKDAVAALDPELERLTDVARARDVHELASVLYVAMTRAAHRLDLVCAPAPKGSADPLSYAAVLRAALVEEGVDAADAPEAGGSRVLWSHPESAVVWFPAPAEPEPEPEREAAAVEPVRELAFAAGAPRRGLARRSPSAEEGGGRATARELLSSVDAAARARGTLVHRWLEEVEWLEEFALDDAQLDALGAALEPDAERRRAALGELRAALDREPIARALRRPAAPPGTEYEVGRERGFSLVLQDDGGQPVLWSGAIDRVVLERRAGELVRARVIDYKTDRVDPAGLGERVEHYRPQLEGYRRVVARLTDLPLDAVEAELLFLHPGLAVEL